MEAGNAAAAQPAGSASNSKRHRANNRMAYWSPDFRRFRSPIIEAMIAARCGMHQVTEVAVFKLEQANEAPLKLCRGDIRSAALLVMS